VKCVTAELEVVEPPEELRAFAQGISGRWDRFAEVAMGPHHPSTHGVFDGRRARGERVVKCEAVIRVSSSQSRKIAENTTYLGSMPYTDRLDYFCR